MAARISTSRCRACPTWATTVPCSEPTGRPRFRSNKLHRQGRKKSDRYRTVSTARSNTARVKLLGNALQLDVAGIARLKASATGQRGDTRLSYKAPTVRLSSGATGIPDSMLNEGQRERRSTSAR